MSTNPINLLRVYRPSRFDISFRSACILEVRFILAPLHNVSMILSAVRSSSPRWDIHRPDISRKSSSRGALHKSVSDYYQGDRASRCVQINKAWNNIGVISLGSRAGWWPFADRVINNGKIESGGRVEGGKRGEQLLWEDIESMDSPIKHIIPRSEKQFLYDVARTLRPVRMRKVYHACFMRIRLPCKKILSLGEVRESTKNYETRLFSRP